VKVILLSPTSVSWVEFSVDLVDLYLNRISAPKKQLHRLPTDYDMQHALYNRGSQPGVHVHIGYICLSERGTFKVSKRKEKYILFISRYFYKYQ